MNGIFNARGTSKVADDPKNELASSTARDGGPVLSARTVSDKLMTDLNDAAPQGANDISVLGSTVRFKGELVADENLMIQGHIEGSIEQKASRLTIGSTGKIKADIHANYVIVEGEVIGNLYATEAVIVESGARVRGDIFAPRVTLKDGATFKGSIDMDASSGSASATPQTKDKTSTPAATSASKTPGKSGNRQQNTTLQAGGDELAETSTQKILG
jgi:cytoskeletal protein CcmA (bactofilin family)